MAQHLTLQIGTVTRRAAGGGAGTEMAELGMRLLSPWSKSTPTYFHCTVYFEQREIYESDPQQLF